MREITFQTSLVGVEKYSGGTRKRVRLQRCFCHSLLCIHARCLPDFKHWVCPTCFMALTGSQLNWVLTLFFVFCFPFGEERWSFSNHEWACDWWKAFCTWGKRINHGVLPWFEIAWIWSLKQWRFGVLSGGSFPEESFV